MAEPSSFRVNGIWAGGSVAGPLLLPDGTAAAPSYSFSNDPAFGWYRIAANQMGLSIGGGLVHQFTGSYYALKANAGTIYIGANDDVAISRVSAGVFGLNQSGSIGVRLSVATDGTLQVLTRAGADTAIVQASAYTVGATAGASFSGAVTNLTVVNGIVTAAS